MFSHFFLSTHLYIYIIMEDSNILYQIQHIQSICVFAHFTTTTYNFKCNFQIFFVFTCFFPLFSMWFYHQCCSDSFASEWMQAVLLTWNTYISGAKSLCLPPVPTHPFVLFQIMISVLFWEHCLFYQKRLRDMDLEPQACQMSYH